MARTVAVFCFVVALVFVSTCTMTKSQSLPPPSSYISLAPSSAPSPAAGPPLTPPPTPVSSPAPAPIFISLPPSLPPTPPSLINAAATFNRLSVTGALVFGTVAAVFIM